MFRKKASATDSVPAVLRGREARAARHEADAGQAANPLARRLQANAEPPTIDLGGPAAFPDPEGTAPEPGTAALKTTSADLERFISSDPQTGKFYVHPGDGSAAVILCGNTVTAPTELRPGDEIRIGSALFRFLTPG